MIAKLIIEKKCAGHALGSAEIRDFIVGFTQGTIPDCQMSSLAMAICCRGMTERETADLTDAMQRSGRCLAWQGVTADKHSTGGVGDKLSLVVLPLAAACGVIVPSLVGRGLGLTGGTADKLETIPGFVVAQPLDRFQQIANAIGLAIAEQSDELCPADKKLYALRDVTGTVSSLPLIVSSILSKKLAEGAGTLVFDVKCGKGAFMKTRDDAHALAVALVAGSKNAGRKATALVTDMNAPLGRCVGNANEVHEALAMLAGKQRGPLLDLCVELAARMVSDDLDAARQMCRLKLADGSALAKFRAMVVAQGGDLDAFDAMLKKPTFKFRIQAMRSGCVTAIDAERVARVALMLGAGREQPGDRIDPRAGVTLDVQVGDRVTVGSPLATLERSREPDGLEKCAAELYKAFEIGTASGAIMHSLILESID